MPERRFRKIELLKLIAARADFTGARRSAKLLLEVAPKVADDLNYPLLVATAVCYSRPYTANEPHGVIPNRYVRGIPSALRHVHDELLDARHKYFAHSDLTERGVLVFPPGCEIAGGVKAGGIGSAMESIRYSNEFIAAAVTLCSHLLGVLHEDIEALLAELYGGRDLPNQAIPLLPNNEL